MLLPFTYLPELELNFSDRLSNILHLSGRIHDSLLKTQCEVLGLLHCPLMDK